SVAPPGLNDCVGTYLPRACARGYIPSPLRGFRAVATETHYPAAATASRARVPAAFRRIGAPFGGRRGCLSHSVARLARDCRCRAALRFGARPARCYIGTRRLRAT